MVGIMRDLVLEDDPILKKRAVLFDFDNPQEDPEKLTEELCKNGQHGPLEVAGVMMAQAMRIYKTALKEEDFDHLIETILESRHGITPIQKPTIN